MSGFKIEQDNIAVEYFGTSNSLKLSITSPDSDEYGNIFYMTDHIWIEPHTNELQTIIKCLQEASSNL